MSRYKIVFSSISTFENLSVILVNFLILPVVSLIMLLLITANGNEDYLRIVLGSVVTTGIFAGIGVINTSFIYDQNTGIIFDILSIRPKFKDYWLPKFVVAIIVIVSEILLLGIIGLVALQKGDLLVKLILALVFVILISLIIGYIGALSGMGRQNPYWLTNILGATMVILSGVIIPVVQYPFWLKIFAILFPVSDLLDWLTTPEIFVSSLYLMIIKTLGWLLVALIISKFKWRLD